MKPEIVLYHPRSSESGKRILPMSLLAVAAVLEDRWPYEIVDGNCSADPLGDIRKRVREGANILAVTVMPGPQLLQAVPHCRALKREFPAVKVVWGGYFPTQHAAACLKSPEIDFVVRGHGEMVFFELLRCLERDEDCSAIQGLSFRDAAGQVIENPLGPIPHPENLPRYPYHRLEMEPYVRRTFLGSRTLPHHSSYGCPFLCNFCAVVNMVQGRWLAQSAGTVAGIARLYARRWAVNAIEFCDNNFFTHEARVAAIATEIEPLKISWWGEARIDTLLKYSEETWRIMRRSGLKMVFMGAESASVEVLSRMDKGGSLTPDKTLEIAEVARRHEVVPEFSFIIGNPPDPEADVRNTLDFIRRLKKINPLSEIILYHYSPVPLAGSLYDTALSRGFAFPETLDEWVSSTWAEFSQRRGAGLPWLNRGVREQVRNFERVLNAYYPTSTDLRLSPARRRMLRMVSAWRYHSGIHEFPFDLRVLQKVLHYQRPETSGF